MEKESELGYAFDEVMGGRDPQTREVMELQVSRRQLVMLREAMMRYVPPGGMGIAWREGDPSYDLIMVLTKALLSY